ncbi:U1 small nuclear ribonucleoprotein C [Achlya hypogyna]|uniref:U1 small nuclear ribonucleoprotein C n=1 Tax=Achlya hypogyna TaxID=1202772 RepID=A0A1V9Z7R9_ACHHY|nr:U1 small nuclear ribonucleoprotein C [Achlya hypogyna]
MPRYYCDYCDTYLTHDSQAGRKQHNRGWKHRENVKLYYEATVQNNGAMMTPGAWLRPDALRGGPPRPILPVGLVRPPMLAGMPSMPGMPGMPPGMPPFAPPPGPPMMMRPPPQGMPPRGPPPMPMHMRPPPQMQYPQ